LPDGQGETHIRQNRELCGTAEVAMTGWPVVAGHPGKRRGVVVPPPAHLGRTFGTQTGEGPKAVVPALMSPGG
jgi:hypothetical protein